MHLVLLSLANIDAGVRMKATSHAFSLTTYLPIPKFINVSTQVQALLTARIYHICIDTITANLKFAEAHGILMSDPSGQICMCCTLLASWIADLPKQHLLACVLSNQSAFTTATSDAFGDLHSCAPRTRTYTLNLIAQACSSTDPMSIPTYIKTSQSLGLNGVHQPFWATWGNADPSDFLTPDVLHAFHKFFFDHPLKWVINIMGAEELDQCMAVLQPRLVSDIGRMVFPPLNNALVVNTAICRRSLSL